MKYNIAFKERALDAAISLLPSYIQKRYGLREYHPPRVYPTSSLDGLRGIAAVIVFIFHIFFSFTNWCEYGYGYEKNNWRIIQLPFLRLVISGHAMVPVFFCVGGYVLSLKPLNLINANQHLALHNTLVSSLFRRALRLYGPPIIATFITMLTLYCGLWEKSREYVGVGQNIIWFADNHIERSPSFRAQLFDWLVETKKLTNVFTYYNKGIMFPYYPHYDPHLWTIPVEFRSGVLLLVTLLAFSRCRPRVRLFFMAACVVFCTIWDRWEMVCFLSGSMLCQIDLSAGVIDRSTPIRNDTQADALTEKPNFTPIRNEYLPLYESTSSPSSASSPRSSRSSSPTRPSRSPRTILHYLLFLLAIHLLCTPTAAPLTSPTWKIFSHLYPTTYTDPKRFPATIGALVLMYLLPRSPSLRRPFETSLAQYLGKISFAIYVVHGPVVHVVGFTVTPWLWQYGTGMAGWKWGLGMTFGIGITGAVVWVVADWFWRVVEGQCVEWAGRLERWAVVEEGR